MVMGAEKRCISLTESPKSEAQMHVLFLKINMHWRVLTSRDVVKNEGGGWGDMDMGLHISMQNSRGQVQGPAAGKFLPSQSHTSSQIARERS